MQFRHLLLFLNNSCLFPFFRMCRGTKLDGKTERKSVQRVVDVKQCEPYIPKKGLACTQSQNHLLVREEISHNWIHPQEYPPPFDQSCIYIGKTITASVVTWLEREIPGLGAMNGLYYHGCTYKDIHYILLMEKILLTSWGWQFIIHCLRRVLAPSKTVVVRDFWTMKWTINYDSSHTYMSLE